jgi:hypothetical protein
MLVDYLCGLSLLIFNVLTHNERRVGFVEFTYKLTLFTPLTEKQSVNFH